MKAVGSLFHQSEAMGMRGGDTAALYFFDVLKVATLETQ